MKQFNITSQYKVSYLRRSG